MLKTPIFWRAHGCWRAYDDLQLCNYPLATLFKLKKAQHFQFLLHDEPSRGSVELLLKETAPGSGMVRWECEGSPDCWGFFYPPVDKWILRHMALPKVVHVKAVIVKRLEPEEEKC